MSRRSRRYACASFPRLTIVDDEVAETTGLGVHPRIVDGVDVAYTWLRTSSVWGSPVRHAAFAGLLAIAFGSIPPSDAGPRALTFEDRGRGPESHRTGLLESPHLAEGEPRPEAAPDGWDERPTAHFLGSYPSGFAVVDAHLGLKRRILVLLQPRQHAEAAEHLQDSGAQGAWPSSRSRRELGIDHRPLP